MVLLALHLEAQILIVNLRGVGLVVFIRSSMFLSTVSINSGYILIVSNY